MKLDYPRAIKAGDIPAGYFLKKAVDRFFDDLQRPDLIFDESRAERVIDFFSRLEHSEGEFSGRKFIPEPWEKFIIYNLYGFYWRDTGARRFRTAYIELARKQGKTAFADGLCLYHLVADGEGAPQVLLAANSRDQAHIAYRLAKQYAKKADPLNQIFKIYRNEILFPAGDGMLKVLAADADRLDGYNCSFGLVDEYHSAKTSRVRDVLRSGQGMRKNPMLVTITTAGYDKTLPCYGLRTVCTEIITGAKKDDSTFAVIYSLDEGDDWKDSKVWIKSNPNLGVTVSENWLSEQVKQAENNPADEVGVLTKNLNVWTDSSETWIPDSVVLQNTEKFSRERFKDKEVYVGVDLASNRDLTAVAYLFAEGEKLYFDVDYYLPNDSLRTRPDKDLYLQWKRQKALKITPGNVTDYNYITRDMMKAHGIHFVVRVAYDPYNSTQWAITSTDEGLPLEQYSQTPGNFNRPTREFERRFLKGDIIVNDNPITRYCMRNVELRRDYNGNVKPDKSNEKKKIDGVTAMIQALAMYHAYHHTFNLKVF